MNAAQKTQFNSTKVKFSPTKAAFEKALSLAKEHDGKLADSDNRKGVFNNTHDGVGLTADFRDPNNIIVKIDQRTIHGQPFNITFTKSNGQFVRNEMLVVVDNYAVGKTYNVLTSTDKYLGTDKNGDENWEYINIDKCPIITIDS